MDHRQRILTVLLAFAAISGASVANAKTAAAAAGGTQKPDVSQAPASPARVEHAIAGEIEKVDHASRTILIRTADGVEETVKVTDRTTVHGLKDISRALELNAKAGLEGGSAVIHYTGQSGDKTAVKI